MAIINKGKSFANGEQLTADKLNQVIDNATFTTSAVDNTSTQLSSGAIIVKDGGVTTAKLNDGAVTTAKLNNSAVTTAKIAAGALTDVVYPVGAIFTTVTNYADSAAVVSAIGGTTWTAFGAGRVLVGLDASDTDFDTAEETGGAKTHTLDITEMPSHRHGGIQPGGSPGTNSNGFDVDSSTNGNSFATKLTTYAGGAGSDANGSLTSPGATQAHNNLQPYIVVYMWKRIA